MFQTYAKMRKATFFLNALVLMGGVLAFVLLSIFHTDVRKINLVYFDILAMLIGCLVYLGVDYHWTNCVVFFWKHPPRRKADISWIDSDSEP